LYLAFHLLFPFTLHSSDDYLVKAALNFANVAKKLQTGMQMADFCLKIKQPRHKTGRKIHPQPANVANRKSKSRSRRVLKAGRPLMGVKKVQKRKRQLTENVKNNVPNAKSHGAGH
jgi:hypothetical protein